MGAWTAWLNFLKRLRESDQKRREERAANPDAWRVPYGDENESAAKQWKGR